MKLTEITLFLPHIKIYTYDVPNNQKNQTYKYLIPSSPVFFFLVLSQIISYIYSHLYKNNKNKYI